MKNLRKDKGITLIALIITIIILLILVGVTINLTLGENGLFKTTQQAAKNYIDAENKEKEDLYNFDNTIKNIVGGKLIELIKPSDYGKSINYSVTVNGTTLNDWKVFYNDGTNVYIIISDYLNNSLIPSEAGMRTSGTYVASWPMDSLSSGAEAVAILTNTNYWSSFARGNGGLSAIGTPTKDIFLASYFAKHPAKNDSPVIYYPPLIETTDDLYAPLWREGFPREGYWLAWSDYGIGGWTVNPESGWYCWNYDGPIDCGLRPVVCLTSGITGTVGDTVTID